MRNKRMIQTQFFTSTSTFLPKSTSVFGSYDFYRTDSKIVTWTWEHTSNSVFLAVDCMTCYTTVSKTRNANCHVTSLNIFRIVTSVAGEWKGTAMTGWAGVTIWFRKAGDEKLSVTTTITQLSLMYLYIWASPTCQNIHPAVGKYNACRHIWKPSIIYVIHSQRENLDSKLQPQKP
jgi:hypothetical protein